MSDYPDVIPMLAYEEGVKAMEWLADAFGFHERTRMTTPQGRLEHGELEAGDAVIMLATPTQVPYIIDGVLVYVDDVSAHYEQAKRAGARILSDVESGANGKRYRAEDLEGHRWMFMERP